MLRLVANRWSVGTSTNRDECEKHEDGRVSIAIFSEQARFLNNKPLLVKSKHQYHEVVRLHSGTHQLLLSYKMDGIAAGTNVADESQGMSLINIWLSS